MTTSKDLEKAIEIVNEYFNFPIDDVDATNFDDMPDCVPKSIVRDVARALYEAHAAGRQSALDEVVPVLEFYADDDNYEKFKDEYQVASYGVIEYETTKVQNDYGKRARELLQKLKPQQE